MNSKIKIIFWVVLLINIIGNILQQYEMVTFSKPLIIPVLAAFFLTATMQHRHRLKKWIIMALLFSWAGDMLLQFVSTNEVFFIWGLVAFLLAHVFYILVFQQLKQRHKIPFKWWPLIPAAIYYAALITYLSPYLGEMAMPVRVYGMVIMWMLMMAFLIYPLYQPAGRYVAIGAALFIVSDSILAINKFAHTIPFSGGFIMLTYGVAQFALIYGLAQFIVKRY